jgi:hypothetical protein
MAAAAPRSPRLRALVGKKSGDLIPMARTLELADGTMVTIASNGRGRGLRLEVVRADVGTKG